MKIFNLLKNRIGKIDDIREFAEDWLANNLLKKINENTKTDDLVKKGISVAIDCAEAYFNKTGFLNEEIKEVIAEKTVIFLDKGNRVLQKQLNKKSKSYKKRHNMV